MKQIFYLLLALPLGLFMACGDEDDAVNSSTNGKRITKIIEESQGTTRERLFTYDSEGRVVKMKTTVNSASESHAYNSTYQYSDSLIKCNEEVVDTDQLLKHTYRVEDGKIVLDTISNYNIPMYSHMFYDKDGFLNEIINYLEFDNIDLYYYPNRCCFINWEKGNMSTQDFRGVKYAIWDYTDLPWKKGTFFEFDNSIIPETDPVLLGMGYYGKLPKNLPSRYGKRLYDYTVSEGLVTKVTRTDSLQTERCVLNITWE